MNMTINVTRFFARGNLAKLSWPHLSHLLLAFIIIGVVCITRSNIDFVCLFVCLFCGGIVNDLYGRRTSFLGKLSLSVVFNEIRVVMRLDWFVFQEPILARD